MCAAAAGFWGYIFTYLQVDGGTYTAHTLDEATSLYGVSSQVILGNNKGQWMGELSAGTYTFKVRYQSNGYLNVYTPWSISIMVL